MAVPLHVRVNRVRTWMTGNTRPTCDSCHWSDVVLAGLIDEDGRPVVDGDDEQELVPAFICRRFPAVDGWPDVDADDWCGEHTRAR